MDKALNDITVLDLGQVIAMPYCTMLLADPGLSHRSESGAGARTPVLGISACNGVE
jgi:hypothetical protein